MKVTIEIDAGAFIEELEEHVPDPTGGKETEESLLEFVNDYDSELRELVEEWLMKKLIHYHTH